MTKVVNRIKQGVGGDETQGFVTTGDVTDVWFTQLLNTVDSTFLSFASREKQKIFTIDLDTYITDKVETPVLDIEFEVGDIPGAMLESVTHAKVNDTRYDVTVTYARPNNTDVDFNLKTRVKGQTK